MTEFERLREGEQETRETTEFERLRGEVSWGSLQGYKQQPQDPSHLPDYEKLTRTERWIMSKLPGIADSDVGKWLIKFNDSWAGKALQVLDVAAEGLERVGGLAAQWEYAARNPGEMASFTGNLKEAWQASSLASDFARVPIYRDGRWIITNDLPGVGGLIEARQRLVNGESFEDVQASMYNDLGTLAIRGQKQDAIQHIFGDPMWLISKYVKPIEMLKLASIRRASKVALPAEIAQQSKLMGRLSVLANKIDDTANLGSEIKKLEKLAKSADEISDLEKLKNIIDNLPYGDLAKAKTKTKTGLLDEITEVIGHIERQTVMKPWEQRLHQFLGTTMGFEKPYAELNMWQKAWRRFNPLALTPKARAHHLIDQFQQNFTSYVLSKADDPAEIVSNLRRILDGTGGSELGHMIATIEGRMLRGMIMEWSGTGQDLLRAWEKTASFERPMLTNLSVLLKDSVPSILKQVRNGESAQVLQRLMDIMAQSPEAKKLIEGVLKSAGKESLTAEMLDGIAHVFKDVDLFSPDMFKSLLYNNMMDSMAKMSIIHFGVESDKFIQKLAGTVKAAETLAYLKLNPAYPIKNLVNNVATSLARGVFGTTSEKKIIEFFEEVIGYLPPRLQEAFSPAELAAETVAKTENILTKGAKKASSVLADAKRGESTILDKITDTISNVGIGKEKWNFGKFAQEIERRSGMGAYYQSFLRHHTKLSRIGKGIDSIEKYAGKAADEISSDIKRAVHGLAESVKNEAGLRASVKADNLNVTMSNVLRTTEQRLGIDDLDDIFTPGFIASFEDDLLDAINKGGDNIDDVIAAAHTRMKDDIAKSIDNDLDNMLDELEALGTTAGPGAYAPVWAGLQDEQYATAYRHALDTHRIAQDIRRGTDPAIADLRWRKYFQESKEYYGKFWIRQEKKFKKLAKVVPGEQGKVVLNHFRDVRRKWKGFYNKREKLWNAYSDAKQAGEKVKKSAKAIQDELDELYEATWRFEDNVTRQIDDTLSGMYSDPAQRDLFMATRQKIADLRLDDKVMVGEFRKAVRDAPESAVEGMYQSFQQQRMVRHGMIWVEERRAMAALEGNSEAVRHYDNLIMKTKATRAQQTADFAETRRIISDIEDTVRDANPNLSGADLANKIDDELDKVGLSKSLVEEAPAIERGGDEMLWIGDFNSMVDRNLPLGVGLEQLRYNRAAPVLDAMRDSAKEIANTPALKFTGLSGDAQKTVKKYLRHVEGQMADIRHASMKMGEYGRDAALLNYNARTNFDTWLGTIVPYEFWMTHTAWNWALHTVDRPAALATFLRFKKFLDTGFRPESGFPSRLKGHIRIKVPFLPDWMGDEVFINPMNAMLPIDNFTRPYEEYMSQERRDVGMAERVLEELWNDGLISQDKYIEALQSHQGATWERAVGLARQDNTEERQSTWDFASMLLSPHAPITWAYNASRGKDIQEGPFLPISRSIRGVAGLLGVDTNDIPGLNIGGKIRETLGLHPFDKWDDYRVNRMMVNMISVGEVINGLPVTIDDIKRAMVEQTGPLWDEAKKRSLQEYGVGAMGSTIGMPIKAYPPGEEASRKNYAAQRENYELAWKMYENGDHAAVNQFLEANPEYEARLALFKKPEEQLRTFLVDQMWDTYNSFPSLNKREVREQLGDDFVRAVLQPETRSVSSLPVEQIAMWIKMMGADPIGSLGDEAIAINLAPPEIAEAAQSFYDIRLQRYPNYYELQSSYFKLNEGSPRRKYLHANPELGDYWGWRWEFLTRNPTIAPYLSDKPPTYQSFEQIEQFQAVSLQEWRTRLGSATFNQVLDLVIDGEMLDDFAIDKIEGLGFSVEEVIRQISQASGL